MKDRIKEMKDLIKCCIYVCNEGFHGHGYIDWQSNYSTSVSSIGHCDSTDYEWTND